MLNVLPLNDWIDHREDTICLCEPRVENINGEMLVIHNALDQREKFEKENEMNNRGINEACREIPMARAKNDLSNTIDEIGKEIEVFCDRLTGYCVPAEPTPKENVKLPPKEPTAPVVAEIEMYNQRLRQHYDRLTGTLRRLEI